MMKWIVIGVIVLIVLMIVIFLIGTYNGLVKSKNQVEEAFSTMDVYLKKRYDLIPNLVETVKGYAKHEQETLEKKSKKRTNLSKKEKIKRKTDIYMVTQRAKYEPKYQKRQNLPTRKPIQGKQ